MRCNHLFRVRWQIRKGSHNFMVSRFKQASVVFGAGLNFQAVFWILGNKCVAYHMRI